MSKPVAGPTVGFKAPWAYLIEDTYDIEFAQGVKAAGKWTFSVPEVLTKDGVTVRWR